MKNADQIFGIEPSILPIIAFLLLVVFSVVVSGALIVARPLIMYLDGKKKDALWLFGLTIAWLAIFLVIALFISAKQVIG